MVVTSSPQANFGFQCKDKDEAFQFYFHQHWIRLFWPFCKLVAWNLIIAAIMVTMLVATQFNETLTRRTILLILTAFFLLSHFEFLIRFYHYLLYIIVVTDKRIHRIKKTLLTVDDHQSTDLWVLQDINKRQHGIIQNILGYGSIILEAQDTEIRIHFTPRITEKYEMLTHLREQARTQISHMEELFRKGKTP
ncbi:MAG: hypothetical protein PHI23_03120 [Candidatus Peribacteraceae bacterium]|nr:hypothetical protein [Candidatus Peribacteraceae bacterium]